MLDVRCSQGFMGENSPKNSRIEPMNRRKTSNTQHPTSNNQWFPIGPLIGGWVLDVGCSMFPRVHGEEARWFWVFLATWRLCVESVLACLIHAREPSLASTQPETSPV